MHHYFTIIFFNKTPKKTQIPSNLLLTRNLTLTLAALVPGYQIQLLAFKDTLGHPSCSSTPAPKPVGPGRATHTHTQRGPEFCFEGEMKLVDPRPFRDLFYHTLPILGVL